MKKAKTLALLIALLVVFVFVVPAGAVNDGELDGDDHPYVVLLRMDVGGVPTWRCSGTLLSSTVLLTAGHCTSNYPDEPYSGMRVFTESDVENGDNTYPTCDGGNCVEAAAWYPHPEYETAPWFLHDVGVVILEEPGVVLDEYGTLPELNQFDAFKTKRGLQKVTFTAVGYGVQQSFPDAASWKDVAVKVRMVAHPRLIQINVPGFTGDFSMLLSNNAHTGGTCFGDSGGPNFLYDTNVVAGVSSFALNGTCGGTGGVFRMDRPDVLNFVNSHLVD